MFSMKVAALYGLALGTVLGAALLVVLVELANGRP